MMMEALAEILVFLIH